ncbi:MAG: TraB/GumN family protein [Desulfobacteraceae bacterium]|nr:TraB/GumN family protein [Desulfobacteraceae bacterium]
MENPAQENNKNIHTILYNDKIIKLIGTAHVSKESAEFVEKIILEERPDTVCVELCNTRLDSIKDKDKWRNMDIIKIIREKKALLLFMNLILASFQKRIAKKFDIQPGQEMINAVNSAQETGATIVPADRDIQITLSRVWRGMGFFKKLKLVFQLLFSLGATDDITEEEIEKMKQEDILKSILIDVKKSHPEIERILIDERDMYLAEKIKTAPGENIVAVVGAGHVPGIKSYIAENNGKTIDELNIVPPAGKLGKILKWGLPAAVFILFAIGFSMGGKSAGTDMIWFWIAANGIFAGLGAIIALAHPYTIISAILAAPLTSLNPMIAAGWVSGLVEAFSRKPKVKDFEAISEDILSIKGFWRNSVIRILLVVVFTNLGSTIGTMAALPLMLKALN